MTRRTSENEVEKLGIPCYPQLHMGWWIFRTTCMGANMMENKNIRIKILLFWGRRLVLSFDTTKYYYTYLPSNLVLRSLQNELEWLPLYLCSIYLFNLLININLIIFTRMLIFSRKMIHPHLKAAINTSSPHCHIGCLWPLLWLCSVVLIIL